MLNIYNLVFSRSTKFIDRASNSSNLLVHAVFRDSSVLVYSFAGFNSMFGSQYLKIYHDDDKYCVAVVPPFLKRNLDIIRGTSDTEHNAPDYFNFIIIISLMHLCWCVFSIIIIIS